MCCDHSNNPWRQDVKQSVLDQNPLGLFTLEILIPVDSRHCTTLVQSNLIDFDDQVRIGSAPTFKAGSSKPSGTSAVKTPEYLGSELCLNLEVQELSPNCWKNIGEAPKLCPIKSKASRAEKWTARVIFRLWSYARPCAGKNWLANRGNFPEFSWRDRR